MGCLWQMGVTMDTLNQVVGFLLNPAFFHAAVGAAAGAAIYAVWDFIQGTAGKPWREHTTTTRRG